MKEDLSKSKLNSNDLGLIQSMTCKDGWCKYFDKSNKRCLIYESRPHFCRVHEFSKEFKDYLKIW